MAMGSRGGPRAAVPVSGVMTSILCLGGISGLALALSFVARPVPQKVCVGLSGPGPPPLKDRLQKVTVFAKSNFTPTLGSVLWGATAAWA